MAQAPSIGLIEIFGINKVHEANIRKALGVKEGDALPTSKSDAEERINQTSNVVESHLEAVCCAGDKVILYVGIEEKGAIHFEVRESPEGPEVVPEALQSAYARFLDAFEEAARRGATAEDLTQGHSLVADADARAIQQEFPELVKANLAELRRVIRNAGDENQRAIAAFLIGYAPRKRDVVDDLQVALRDADAGVRANAVKALVAITIYARLNPDQGVKIQPTWFVEMLNSLSFSDRNEALKALELLTEGRDQSMLAQLKDRAMPSLIQMARWKTLDHALPAYVLLGRVAGMTEEKIQEAWNKGDLEATIRAATGKKKK